MQPNSTGVLSLKSLKNDFNAQNVRGRKAVQFFPRSSPHQCKIYKTIFSTMVRMLLQQRPVQGQFDSSSSSSRTASPSSNNSEKDATKDEEMKPVSPLSKFLGNDPNEMVILSGIFVKLLITPLQIILSSFTKGPFLSEDKQSR